MKKYLLFLIITIAACFRFIYLDVIPNAVSGDELHYINTAKAVFLTGHDLTGTWNPWSIFWFRYPPNEHQAELPYLLHFMSAARFPFSLLLIKLPFALLSVGIVILLYAVAGILFGPRAALATGIIAAINPWLVIMGRTGYEATPAMFFYLLSLWTILKTKKWNILWTFVPLTLAFYSYIGTKVLFLPFVLAINLLAYAWNGRKFAKSYIMLSFLSTLLVICFFMLTKTDPSGSRLGELFLPNSPTLAQSVNSMRSTTIESPVVPFFINKYVLFAQTILDKIFRIFSPSYLFTEGDQFFLPVRHGFFYYPDAIFLILGLIFLARKHHQLGRIILFLIVLSSLPQLVSTTMGDFSIHLTLLFPMLLIVIGLGMAQIPKKSWVLYIFIVLYLFSIAGFSIAYFYRAPLMGYADFPKRILTKYLLLAAAGGHPVTVHAASTSETFQKYMLYADIITANNIPALRKAISSPTIQFNGILFEPCTSYVNKSTVIDDALCGKPANQHHNSITTLTDGGETYIIYEDKVCNKYELKRYPEHINLKDFDIEHLSERQFCEVYISQR